MDTLKIQASKKPSSVAVQFDLPRIDGLSKNDNYFKADLVQLDKITKEVRNTVKISLDEFLQIIDEYFDNRDKKDITKFKRRALKLAGYGRPVLLEYKGKTVRLWKEMPSFLPKKRP